MEENNNHSILDSGLIDPDQGKMFDEQDASETLLMLSTSNKKYAYEYLNTYILYSILQNQTLAQGGLKATKQKCNFASIIVAYLFCSNSLIGIVTKDKKSYAYYVNSILNYILNCTI